MKQKANTDPKPSKEDALRLRNKELTSKIEAVIRMYGKGEVEPEDFENQLKTAMKRKPGQRGRQKSPTLSESEGQEIAKRVLQRRKAIVTAHPEKTDNEVRKDLDEWAKSLEIQGGTSSRVILAFEIMKYYETYWPRLVSDELGKEIIEELGQSCPEQPMD